MSPESEIFDELKSHYHAAGPDAALEYLAQRLQAAGRYHDWFEVLKIQLRRSLHLSPNTDFANGPCDDSVKRAWEAGLMDACRRVGLRFLDEGRVREGWLYLRPLGDLPLARARLHRISVDDTNREDLIEIFLQEGVDPVRGFEMILEHHGTCNAVTVFETRFPLHDPAMRSAAAELLVRRLHQELVENVRADIGRREGHVPPAQRLSDLLASRDWLRADSNYHVDISHLAAAVRAGRFVASRESLELALELAAYGAGLDRSLQFPGQAPFTDLYAAHEIYLRALLGSDADVCRALDYFGAQAAECDVYHEGSLAVEVYVELLVRLGRIQEAIAIVRDRLPPNTRTVGVAPSLQELCRLQGDYQPLRDVCRSHDDWVGFLVGLIEEPQQKTACPDGAGR